MATAAADQLTRWLSRWFIALDGAYCEIGETSSISSMTASSRRWEHIGMLGRRSLKNAEFFCFGLTADVPFLLMSPYLHRRNQQYCGERRQEDGTRDDAK